MRNALNTLDQEVIIVPLTNVLIIRDYYQTVGALIPNAKNLKFCRKMENVKSASHTPDHKTTVPDVARTIAQRVSFNLMELAWIMAIITPI